VLSDGGAGIQEIKLIQLMRVDFSYINQDYHGDKR